VGEEEGSVGGTASSLTSFMVAATVVFNRHDFMCEEDKYPAFAAKGREIMMSQVGHCEEEGSSERHL
jgi:hypothetical protein